MRGLLPLLVLFVSACAPLGNPGTRGSAAATLADVRYEPPAGYGAAEASAGPIAVHRAGGYDGGLFIAALPSSEGMRDLVVMRVLLDVSRALSSTPEAARPFLWEPVAAPSGDAAASSFEVYNTRRHGFDGERRVVAQFRHLRHDGRDLLTGYYYVAGTGAEGRRQFESGTVGDSLAGGQGWATLVESLTGERPRDLTAPPPPAAGPR